MLNFLFLISVNTVCLPSKFNDSALCFPLVLLTQAHSGAHGATRHYSIAAHGPQVWGGLGVFP